MVKLSRSLGGSLHQHFGNTYVLNREVGVTDKTTKSEVRKLWESCQSRCELLMIDCEQETQQSRQPIQTRTMVHESTRH